MFKWLRWAGVGLAIASAVEVLTLQFRSRRPEPEVVSATVQAALAAIEGAAKVQVPDELVGRMVRASLAEYEAWASERARA